jgi:putative inorganic carbon (HCO3(-)) transporter
VLYLIKLKKVKTSNTIEDFILVIFSAIILISTLFSVNIYQSLAGGEFREEGLAALLCYFFIYFIVSRYYTFDEKHIKYLFISSLIISVYAIVQYFGVDPLKVKSHLIGSVSTIGNRNFLGSYLTLIMPISMFLFIKTKQFIYLFLNAVFFMALLCSYTRGAWVAFSLCLILFVYYETCDLS